MTTLPISTPSPKPSQQQLQRRAERVRRRRRARKQEIPAASGGIRRPPHELRVLLIEGAVGQPDDHVLDIGEDGNALSRQIQVFAELGGRDCRLLSAPAPFWSVCRCASAMHASIAQCQRRP